MLPEPKEGIQMPEMRACLQQDLNACINIARRLMRSAGWRELGFEPADEGKGVKPSLNAGSSQL
jgi:hypothetical protein